MGRKIVVLGIIALAIGLWLNGCAAWRKKRPVSKIEVEVVKPTPGVEEKAKEEALAALKGKPLPLAKVPKKKIFKEPVIQERAIFTDIHFDFDKSVIKPEARPTLNKVASWLKKNPDTHLMIEGHCDERGTEEYNLALGERRALSARRYLIGLGILSERLHTISYGELRPLYPRHNEEAWAKNRRAHFLISE
ncbi:MAG: peptidoglycan-associated lipoprotein Pal [Candidatus Omnitrophica bacterium]|nr:peptidoglycan-associated lipoprotein Pal [Candidatus Omnitrophota bacterium]